MDRGDRPTERFQERAGPACARHALEPLWV